METAWIKVFVLILSECVAPAGKTVCQDQEIEMQFLSHAECELALEQLISLKDQFENVIVNRQRSSCTASARQQDVFASLDEVKSAVSESVDWRDPENAELQMAASNVSHQGRVEKLTSCEESLGIAPCKMGDIIVEGATSGRPVDIWRSD
jgi:hypothetical protein